MLPRPRWRGCYPNAAWFSEPCSQDTSQKRCPDGRWLTAAFRRGDGAGLECLYQHSNDEFVVHETFLGETGDLVFTVWPGRGIAGEFDPLGIERMELRFHG